MVVREQVRQQDARTRGRTSQSRESWVPQFAQVRASGAAHSSQNFAADRILDAGIEDTSCRDLQRGQGEAKSRALAWSAGHRDPPAVQLNKETGDHEPQPRAAARLGRAIVGPEEFGKELRLILGREANAGVTHVHPHEPIVSAGLLP